MASDSDVSPTSLGQRILWHAVAAVSTAVTLVVAYLWHSQSFYIDDKRNQYLPVATDIGHRLAAGEWLPLIDPNLGPSGNYSLDVQYGVYDPTHWIVDIGLSHVSNLALGGFLWALPFEIVLAVGVSVLSARLRVPLPWCAVAGLGVATGGWVFFHLAADWIPGLVSLAWIPWLWWAWLGVRRGPRVRDCVAIAVFGWLVVAGGWPSTWLFLGVLFVAWIVESWLRRAGRDDREPVRMWLADVGARTLALASGVVLAVLTVVPLLRAAPLTNRKTGIGNHNFLIANLSDVLSFAAPQLRGDILTFGSDEMAQPIFFVAWFAAVVLWTHRWSRETWRRPAIPTCVIGMLAMLLLTEGPSTLGPVHDQIRQLAGVQTLFVIGVCVLAGSGRWVVTRGRMAGIVLTLGAMAWLTFSRHPDGIRSGFGIAVELLAAAGLLLLARLGVRSVALGAVISTMGLTLLAFGVYEHNVHTPSPFPDRPTAGTLHVDAADQPMFVATGTGTQEGWTQWQLAGIGRGFSDLSVDDRMQPGYSSVSQRPFRQLLCIRDAQGQGCPDEIQRLMRIDPVTKRPWVDLLGYRTLFVQRGARASAMTSGHWPDWHRVGAAGDIVEYRRSGPIALAGRVTDVVGRAHVVAESVSNESQSYRVSAPAGARLIFRDIYWPGYVATLDGRRLPVTTLDHVLVSVALPKGASGTLTVVYRPLSTRDLVAIPAFALLLLALAVCLIRWPQLGGPDRFRSRRRRSASTAPRQPQSPAEHGP